MKIPDRNLLKVRDELEQALFTLPRDDPNAETLRRMLIKAIELSGRLTSAEDATNPVDLSS